MNQTLDGKLSIKNIQKIFPVAFRSQQAKEPILEGLKKTLGEFVQTQRNKGAEIEKFSIEVQKRCNDSFDSTEAKVFFTEWIRPELGLSLDYNNFDLMIFVNVIGGQSFLSYLLHYNKYKKYNIFALMNDSKKLD